MFLRKIFPIPHPSFVRKKKTKSFKMHANDGSSGDANKKSKHKCHSIKDSSSTPRILNESSNSCSSIQTTSTPTLNLNP